MSKDIWSKLGHTIRSGAENIVHETKELTKVGRLKVELMSLENERGRELEELGRKTYSLYRIGTSLPPELSDDLSLIDQTEKKIEQKNREIEAKKIEDEIEKETRAERKIYCSQCGAELREGDIFCWKCGSKVV